MEKSLQHICFVCLILILGGVRRVTIQLPIMNSFRLLKIKIDDKDRRSLQRQQEKQSSQEKQRKNVLRRIKYAIFFNKRSVFMEERLFQDLITELRTYKFEVVLVYDERKKIMTTYIKW
jgi:hypothetical protein